MIAAILLLLPHYLFMSQIMRLFLKNNKAKKVLYIHEYPEWTNFRFDDSKINYSSRNCFAKTRIITRAIRFHKV